MLWRAPPSPSTGGTMTRMKVQLTRDIQRTAPLVGLVGGPRWTT
jgi:hypothetical protein